MSNEELVAEIQAGNNVQGNMGDLWEQTKNFIYMMVKPYSQYCEIDDLMQESYFALVDAVNGFRDDNDSHFLTYLAYWVRAKARLYMYNHGSVKRVSVPMHERIQKYKRMIDSLGHIPTDEEAMKGLNLSKTQYDNMVKAMYEMTCVSMDSPVQGMETEVTIAETIADDTDIESDVIDGQALSGVWECVNQLDDRKKQVILKRFREDMTLGQIADAMGVSSELVRQIEKKAFRTLQKMEHIQSLAESFGYDSKMSYSSGYKAMKDGKSSSVEFIAMKHVEYEQKQKELLKEFDDLMNMII